MSELFANLGINWKILAAQIINFAILLFILRKFLYKPLLKVLNSRREEIAKAHANAKEIEEKLKAADAIKEDILDGARTQSVELIKKAEANALQAAEKITADARADIARLNAEERTKMSREREKMLQDTTAHLGETIAMAVEKSIGDVLDEKSRSKLVTQAMEKMKT